MASFTDIDTDRIKDEITTINNLIGDYDSIINKLFRRISDVPYTTHEWIGKTSEKYVELVLFDKEDFVNFSSQLRSYTDKLSNDCDSINKAIKISLEKEKGA